jgi:hypothetical protein
MMLSYARAGLSAALVVGLIAAATDAGAVGTRTFVLDTLEKLSGGDLKGVAVSSDGTVRAGFTLANAPLADASSTFSSLVLPDGSTLLGTSPKGKIFRFAGDNVSVYADTGALAVTSMVRAKDGTVYAATMPDGKVFKITPNRAELFATLADASHVWALVLDRAGTGLFAATGPDGKVFRIEPSGTSSVYYRTSEAHLVSLARMGNGDLLAGSSGKSNLYRISGPGRATVLASMPGEEVKAIAVYKDTIWAIANEYGEPPEAPKRSSSTAHEPPSPSSAPRLKAGKGVLFRFDASGRPERMMKHDDTHYMSLSVDESGRCYVGTGANGRLYTVDDAHVVTLLADTDERQVGAIAIEGGRGLLATSDPPMVHRILAQGGANAVWTSKVLDASLRAKFGQISWHATGLIEFSSRSGNTALPDATWSPWSAPATAPGPVAVPAGRFVQVRGSWTRDPNAVLTEVTIPFVTDNVRPVVTEVTAVSKNGPVKEPVATMPSSGSEAPKHDSVVKLSWKVDNTDSDALRYRIAFKREGQTQWRDALRPDEVLTKPELEWDTGALPEGKYRLRIEASDEPSNPPQDVQKHALESDTVWVDNTPPRVDSLTLDGRRLRVHIIDRASPIARVELAVDGKNEWRSLPASDGIYDTPEERVDADVSELVPKASHILVVRAFDTAGNAVTRDVESR